MKPYLFRGMLLFLAFLLTACSYCRPSGPEVDLVTECWQNQVMTCPKYWFSGADSWFVNGEIKTTEEMSRNASESAAISVMKVRVANNISSIRANGNFRLQIFGTNDCNSLYLYGPNEAIRGVIIRMHAGTLCLEEAADSPASMKCVIVRVGVRNLRHLLQSGSGSIEARMVRTHCLEVNSSGCGNIYLSGAFNLTRAYLTGKGCISLLGAITPELDVTTTGSGTLNIAGNVGIRSITHHGSGNINIVGANSNGLRIYADGTGKISIYGRVNICSLDARDRVGIFAYYVNGSCLNALATDNACVGLAGCAKTLYVNACRQSRFQGKYLYTDEAFVHANDAAHVNVTSASKVFASSIKNSSVYYFGSPTMLTGFNKQNGVILMMPSCNPRPGCGYCPYYSCAPCCEPELAGCG